MPPVHTHCIPLHLVLYRDQVLLKWNLQRGVVVIPKASSEGHLRENLEGMFKWKLTNEQKVGVAGEGERERCVWGGGTREGDERRRSLLPG